MSSPARARSRYALALLAVAALAAPKPSLATTFAMPHVLEVSGTIHSSNAGTAFGFTPVEVQSTALITSGNTPVCAPCGLPIGGVARGVYTFDTTLYFEYSGSAPQSESFFDVFTEIEWTRLGDPVGGGQTFETEMLALELVRGLMIRESPTLRSRGQYTVQPLPGGGYEVDSFFDIFTELSLDGGQTWTPADSALHIQLVPEPSTALLAAIGLAGLALRGRRR